MPAGLRSRETPSLGVHKSVLTGCSGHPPCSVDTVGPGRRPLQPRRLAPGHSAHSPNSRRLKRTRKRAISLRLLPEIGQPSHALIRDKDYPRSSVTSTKSLIFIIFQTNLISSLIIMKKFQTLQAPEYAKQKNRDFGENRIERKKK